jgi:hypothetical protein
MFIAAIRELGVTSRTSTMKKTFLLGQIIFLFGCSNKYLRTPAIPRTKISVDKEMAHIENTDQTDRKQTMARLLFFHNGKTAKRIMYRDSLRVARVKELIKTDLIQSDSAKFSAGIVLFHNGYSKKALRQFNEVNTQTNNNAMKLNSQTWINICIKDTLTRHGK